MREHRTTNGEQRVGLFPLRRGHTLQGVVLSVVLADVQATLHLTPAKGRFCQHGDLRGLPLGCIGQV